MRRKDLDADLQGRDSSPEAARIDEVTPSRPNSRRDPSTAVRKLLRVLTAQAVVFVSAGAVAVVLLAAGGGAIAPRMISYPLVPVAPHASADAVVGALRDAFPGDDVRVEGNEIFIVFEHNTYDVQRASALLRDRGFATNQFTMGRDLGVAQLAGRMTAAFRSAAVLLLVMPAAFLTAGLVLRRRLRPEQGFRQPSAGRIVAAGLGGGVALALATSALGVLLDALGRPIVEQPLIEHISRSDSAMPLLMLLVAGLVVAPIGEELFYRGWVFPYLEKVAAPLAYGASTFLFAAVHFHPAAVPAYLLLGMGLAALYHWSRSIWTPILAHATNNAIAIGTLLMTG